MQLQRHFEEFEAADLQQGRIINLDVQIQHVSSLLSFESTGTRDLKPLIIEQVERKVVSPD